MSGTKQLYAAIDEAIRIVQYIRNKSLRLWMNKTGTSPNDLQTNCAVLIRKYHFAKRLNSQASQTAANRAWFAISLLKKPPWMSYKPSWKNVFILGGAHRHERLAATNLTAGDKEPFAKICGPVNTVK